jgi:transcriptional regulator with XRE-family HTH domain
MRRSVDDDGPSDEEVLRWRELGKRIRRRRKDLRLSQVEVARFTGCRSSSLLSELELGKRPTPDLAFWVRLAEILQLETVALLDAVWRARGSIELHYPGADDTRRRTILEVAVAQQESGPLTTLS